MDEEDVLDSQKDFKLKNITFSNPRFRIRFKIIFIICIIIMIFDQIMKYFGYLPELFLGGDYIFHFLQSTISIGSQLGASIAAAIVFYFLVEYINAKKRKDDLCDIRKYLLYTIYAHMNLICNIKSFDILNRDKCRLKGSLKMFMIIDLPYFFLAYDKISNERIAVELNDFFSACSGNIESKKNLIYFFSSFKENIKALGDLKVISAYKGFREDIETLMSDYEEFYNAVTIYKYDENPEYFEMIIENYIPFLDSTVEAYCYIEKYIETLEDFSIVQFMKLHE